MNTTYRKMGIQERAALTASLSRCLKDNDNVSFAYLFGSFKDYDDAVGFQDIDIGVYITGVNPVRKPSAYPVAKSDEVELKNRWNNNDNLSNGVNDVLDYALGLAAELSFKHNLTIQCIPLNIAPLFFKYRIFKDGTILFYKDENLMTDIMEETAINALDFMPLREEAIRDLE